MKLLLGICFVIFVGLCGFLWIRNSTLLTSEKHQESKFITIEGILQQAKGDDYNYIVIHLGKTIGITSQVVDLSQYEEKSIQATGQYSGTTFYADTVMLSK